MARFYGMVGYAQKAVETPEGSGIYKNSIVERPYFGDVLRNTRTLEDGSSVNDDISVGNSISVIADQYANQHFHAIKYVDWAGSRWKVSSVEVKSPRLILSLGALYND